MLLLHALLGRRVRTDAVLSTRGATSYKCVLFIKLQLPESRTFLFSSLVFEGLIDICFPARLTVTKLKFPEVDWQFFLNKMYKITNRFPSDVLGTQDSISMKNIGGGSRVAL